MDFGKIISTILGYVSNLLWITREPGASFIVKFISKIFGGEAE